MAANFDGCLAAVRLYVLRILFRGMIPIPMYKVSAVNVSRHFQSASNKSMRKSAVSLYLTHKLFIARELHTTERGIAATTNQQG